MEGGGACWSASTCDPDGRSSFNATADTSLDGSGGDGIFAFDNPENPIRDWSVVFVPYCTGDVHLGDATVTFDAPERDGHAAHSFVVHFRGAANVAQALQWTYAHFAQPKAVFVTGSSAGAVPSPFYAAQVAAHYPRARVVELGDAAGGYRSPEIGRISRLSGALDVVRRQPGFTTLDSAHFNFEALYARASAVAPRVSYAQYNAQGDSTQIGFLRLLGVRRPDLPALLAANLGDIRAANPAFRSYTSPGFVHTILGRPAFYTLEVDGVRFRDWLADLVEGRAVRDIGDSLLDPGSRSTQTP